MLIRFTRFPGDGGEDFLPRDVWLRGVVAVVHQAVAMIGLFLDAVNGRGGRLSYFGTAPVVRIEAEQRVTDHFYATHRACDRPHHGPFRLLHKLASQARLAQEITSV
jgi:hypothetical protein